MEHAKEWLQQLVRACALSLPKIAQGRSATYDSPSASRKFEQRRNSDQNSRLEASENSARFKGIRRYYMTCCHQLQRGCGRRKSSCPPIKLTYGALCDSIID
jgi:hypothetical protein